MNQHHKVAVFGAGSWGTAFSVVLADAGNQVSIWGRREELCTAINKTRENPDYLPGITLPEQITATHDPEEAAAGADIVVLAVPSQTLRANLEDWASVLAPDAVLVSLMKGVELGTLKRMSEVIAEITGAGPDRIAVVSGPNLSKEIARREPAASVVACADESVAQQVQDRVHGSMFRPYTSVDVVGCEIGGAYKNVVGIAVGMAVGLGFGDNTTASLITRGLAETARVAKAFDANPMTLMGLAGLGDLVATCSSPLSRNRSFGEKLGKGMTTDDIYASTRQVAEGAKSCASLHALARREGVYVPIAEAVDAVVAGKMTAADTMESFIARDTKAETTDRRVGGVRRARTGLVSRRLALSTAVRSGKGLLEVGPEVVDVLDADGHPDEALGDGRGLALPAPAALERRLDAAERGGVHPQRRGVGEQVGGLGGRQHGRDDRTEARVADRLDGRVRLEPTGELDRVGLRRARPAGAGCAGRAGRARPPASRGSRRPGRGGPSGRRTAAGRGPRARP